MYADLRRANLFVWQLRRNQKKQERTRKNQERTNMEKARNYYRF
jgi:hypothetical protein